MSRPEISACIVTLQSSSLLHDCLESLYANTASQVEVIVVDNGSTDGVEEMLAHSFPQVQLIKNDHNAGFTRPMNQAIRASQGNFVLQLNPDTIVLQNSLDRMVSFMKSHPEIGICGPKVLNRDGSLQKPCRRGDARPWAVITYFTGLSSLFPKQKLFCGYLMSYIDEDQTHPVDGVSGSCMLIRREVIDKIGLLDERYFAYQEDADYCLRARQAGWQVYYYPEVKIIHFGGMGGSQVQPYRAILEWHRSYFLYYRKHFAGDYFFLFNWAYYSAMFLKLISALLLKPFRKKRNPPTPLRNQN